MGQLCVTSQSSVPDTMQCPLCLGEGELSRAVILDRLGVRDFARVAQLSAEEAFRLLQQKHSNDHQAAWSRFEIELTKRTADIEQKHREELRTSGARIKELESAANASSEQKILAVQRIRAELESRLRSEQSQREDLNRRVGDYFKELTGLRERNQELESQMSKVARRGKLEEVSFEDEVQTWPGIGVSEKLGKNGDYLLAFRDPSGAQLEPRLLVDCKDKTITESDIRKLIRDAKERKAPVAVIAAKDESQLRQVDRECRWGQEDGIWLLRTTRQWFRRDLDVLRPMLERMRTEGADFLEKNSALGEEVCRTLVDLDEVEKELKKAAKAIDSAVGLTAKYRVRLQGLCDRTQV